MFIKFNDKRNSLFDVERHIHYIIGVLGEWPCAAMRGEFCVQ